MFDLPYPYNQTNHVAPKPHEDTCYNIGSIHYQFKGKGKNSYIVNVEVFDYHVYVIKFYLRAHKSCKHRYKRKTNSFDCSRVLATIGKIMVEIYNSNPYASFAFVGESSMGEEKANTKRFRLYRNLAITFFGPVKFDQEDNVNFSSTILINRTYNEDNLFEKIETMFKTIYTNFDEPEIPAVA